MSRTTRIFHHDPKWLGFLIPKHIGWICTGKSCCCDRKLDSSRKRRLKLRAFRIELEQELMMIDVINSTATFVIERSLEKGVVVFSLALRA